MSSTHTPYLTPHTPFQLLTALALVLTLHVNATNYYLSNAGSDNNSGTSSRQPWQTVRKLENVRLQPGDSVLFKSGEVFTGGFSVNSSGTAGKPIVFASYDKGAKPVITGFATASEWKYVSNGIWETPVPTGGKQVNMVAMEGASQAMGRYPNKSAAEKGYLSYESFDGLNSITDKQWTSAVNWKGAELVIRKNRYIIDRGTITGQSGGTFFYKSPTNIKPTEGYGYFIQNDPRTLDQPGEWYYNNVQKIFRMFFGQKKPADAAVKISTIDLLLRIQSQHDITVYNLAFEGANEKGLEIVNGTGISVLNCNISFSGVYAINANSLQNLHIENCLVEHSNSNGLYIAPFCTNTVIRNNKINNIGLQAGMGKNDHQQLIPLIIQGEGQRNLVEYNEITNAGYNAIVPLGDSFLVQRNFINNFCLTIDDGGGIYSAGDYNRKGRKILNNIILNGKGVHEGTAQAEDLAANGIYMDDRSANVEIGFNTVAFCSENGLFVHNAHEIDLHDNLVYNNRIQCTIQHDRMEPGDAVTNLRFTNNTLVAGPKQSILRTFNVSPDMSKFGVIDSNVHVMPMAATAMMQVNYRTPTNDLQTQSTELEGWKSRYGYDRYTRKISLPPVAAGSTRFEYNATRLVKTVPLTGTYTDPRGKSYTGSIKIDPYRAALLMRKK